MKAKTTRRALLMSALSLLLCVSMLVGTTFAWFTDSVTSGRNTIQAGNLDVVLEYWDGDSYEEVTSTTKLFDDAALWEPGYTEVAYLKVSNAGSLELKYQLAVNVYKETEGKTKDGTSITLSDHLQFKVVESDTDLAGTYTRETAQNANATATKLQTYNSEDKPLDAKNEAGDNNYYDYVALIIYMPETVGNEANHDGVNIPSIEMGVNLLATQQTAESDSFNDQYDKDADYVEYDYKVDTLDELKEAFAKGGNVLLTDDIEFEKITAIEPGADVYLNLNGKTITVDEETTSNTLIWVKEGAKLTVDGNGTIDLGSVSTMAIFCPYGELVIENGTFIRDKVTTVTNATTGLFMGAQIVSSNVTINGGYFDPGYYDSNAANIEDILAGTAVFTETADDIAKRGVPTDANLVRVAVKDNVSAILNHSGYGSFKVYGGTFVGANPAWGDEGCMLPTTPNYLRPWSYYQGALLDGQVYNENGVVLPDGYTITRSVNADNVPVYTVTYSK